MSTQHGNVYAIKSDRSKLLIHGFIKMMQRELFSDNIDNPYYDIPPLVINICIWFYHCTDFFSMSGSDLKINETGDTVTCIRGHRNSAFGNIGIDLNKINNMIYRWDLEILQFDETYLMSIGFASDRTTYLNGDFNQIEHPEEFYEIDSDGNCNSHRHEWAQRVCEYGFGTGDMVAIELDTKNRNIIFFINGIDQGILFREIPKKKYYLAVTFRTIGDSVKIVDFVERRIA